MLGDETGLVLLGGTWAVEVWRVKAKKLSAGTRERFPQTAQVHSSCEIFHLVHPVNASFF